MTWSMHVGTTVTNQVKVYPVKLTQYTSLMVHFLCERKENGCHGCGCEFDPVNGYLYSRYSGTCLRRAPVGQLGISALITGLFIVSLIFIDIGTSLCALCILLSNSL